MPETVTSVPSLSWIAATECLLVLASMLNRFHRREAFASERAFKPLIRCSREHVETVDRQGARFERSEPKSQGT